MGYYNNLLLTCYDACAIDAKNGIKSDPLKTAQAIESAEKNALPINQISPELQKKLDAIKKVNFFGND